MGPRHEKVRLPDSPESKHKTATCEYRPQRSKDFGQGHCRVVRGEGTQSGEPERNGVHTFVRRGVFGAARQKRRQPGDHQAGKKIRADLRQHHPSARIRAGVSRQSIDGNQKRRITRHAQINRRDLTADGHRVDVVLQPVRGDLLIKNRVAGVGGKLQNEKQPQAEARG